MKWWRKNSTASLDALTQAEMYKRARDMYREAIPPPQPARMNTRARTDNTEQPEQTMSMAEKAATVLTIASLPLIEYGSYGVGGLPGLSLSTGGLLIALAFIIGK